MAFVFRGCFINTLALPTKHHKKVLKSQYIFLYGNVENLGTLCYTASYISEDERVDVLLDYVFPPPRSDISSLLFLMLI